MVSFLENKIEFTREKYEGYVFCGPSKSRFIRIALADFLSKTHNSVILPENKVLSQDEIATVNALSSLKKGDTTINCGESATLFRYLAVVSCLFEKDVSFILEGTLSNRPFDELCKIINSIGVDFSFSNGKYIKTGKVDFSKISNLNASSSNTSQIIGGLCYLLSFGNYEGKLYIGKNPVSLPYIKMTVDILSEFGKTVNMNTEEGFIEFSNNKSKVENVVVSVPEDESQKAVFRCSNLLGDTGIILNNDTDLLQPDSSFPRIADEIRNGKNEISLKDTPDLVFLLSLVASTTNRNIRFIDCKRLRGKESDRFSSCIAFLEALGVSVFHDNDSLTVCGNGRIHGGVVDARNDHRIVMAAWVASTMTDEKITVINGNGAVNKSFPDFFDIVKSLAVLK